MNRIRFRVIPPVDRPGDEILVTGNVPALGDWEPAGGLRLVWEPPYHLGEILLETGTHLEFKVTRGSWESEAVDAFGNVPENSTHDVWLDHVIALTVPDWKDRYQGRLSRDRVSSKALAGGRELLVWLPPGYATHSDKRFPVIFLQDGANVFDPATSVVSGVDLAADEWVSLLAREGAIPEAIVVGVLHPEGFSEENHTLRDFDLSPELGGAAYAHFVATELVRHMDAHYRTIANPASRVLGGAALGALSTFYTALRYPGTFGGFFGLSTSFEDVSGSPPSRCEALEVLAREPALPPATRMFFDFGTHGLDECYEPYHADLGCLLREKGWKEGRDFVIARTPEGTHDEVSWRSRLGPALRFLFS